jgi:hypothetical protein
VTFRIVVEGLKLPTLNDVFGMPVVRRRTPSGKWEQFSPKRDFEKKRVRKLVQDAAMYGHGLVNPMPLEKATVTIRAYGPYNRTDANNIYDKDLIDSIVARPIRAYGRNVGRRWGLICQDDRKTVGKVDFDDVPAETYKVEIEVSAC